MIETDIKSDRRSFLRGTVTVAGVAVILPGLATLSGCKSAPPEIASRMDLISAVADRIIPATDTGGALEAKVPEYIAAVFEKHFTDEQKASFADALEVLDARADGGYAKASAEQQDAILADLLNGDGEDADGFRQLRDMTIFGYYTSEVATNELAYEELPARYDGCVPLSEVGRAWLDRGV